MGYFFLASCESPFNKPNGDLLRDIEEAVEFAKAIGELKAGAE